MTDQTPFLQAVTGMRDEVEVMRSLLTKILAESDSFSRNRDGSAYIDADIVLTTDELALVEKIRGKKP